MSDGLGCFFSLLFPSRRPSLFSIVIDVRQRCSFSLIFSFLIVYVYIGNGSTNDANQMLVNISSNQTQIANTVPIHCSLTSSSSSSSTSSSQGHEEDNDVDDEDERGEQEQEAVQVNEDNIDDNQQSRQEDASSHNCNVVVPPLTQKKLKHFYSSSTLLPSNRPRSSTSSAATAMLRQHHPCHETYRTLQLPINASEKFLMVSPTGQHRTTLNTSAASENNLQRKNIRMYSGTTNPSNDETVRTLSRGKKKIEKSFFMTLRRLKEKKNDENRRSLR